MIFFFCFFTPHEKNSFVRFLGESAAKILKISKNLSANLLTILSELGTNQTNPNLNWKILHKFFQPIAPDYKMASNLLRITSDEWLDWFTLCRSRVWISMKVLRPNSIILGTRKLWWIFPIKQKFDTTAAFLDNPKCSIWSNLTIFLTVFSETSRCTMVKKLSQNFCLV